MSENFTDPRDGKVYKTVKIGNQVWMAENLNYEVEGSKCYDNDSANGQKYGRLYNWETAKKACPEGWHLPSNSEWQELVNFVGGKIAGKKLKAKNGWDYNGNGTDDYGFSALPGGVGYSSGRYMFGSVGRLGRWWTATEVDACYRYMCDDAKYVGSDIGSKTELYSVRCVRVDLTGSSSSNTATSESGCYIATAVYGSYDCPEVWTLRRFRDNELSNLWLGRWFIRIYYAVSPKIVELFGNKKWFSKLWKPIINKIVHKLQNGGIDKE